jgi:CRP/FNR family transcriptional regulator, cyclic AMP receptor protein
MGTFAAYLRETELFYNLSPQHLGMIEKICEERFYQPGDVIFQEQSHENELYLIIQGQVDILVDPNLVSENKENNSGPAVIERFWPGQSFGEMALVDEGVRSGSAIAGAENTHVLRIPRKELLNLCEAYPDLGYRIMYNLALDLSQKIRSTGLKIREAILQNRQDTKQDPGQ